MREDKIVTYFFSSFVSFQNIIFENHDIFFLQWVEWNLFFYISFNFHEGECSVLKF